MIALPGWCLIEPEEEKRKGELYIPDSAKSEMYRGTVASIGATYLKDGVETTSTVSVGDRVAYKKYFDNDLDISGKKYKVVPVEQVMVKL